MLAMKYLKAFNDICLNSILAKDLDNKKESLQHVYRRKLSRQSSSRKIKS